MGDGAARCGTVEVDLFYPIFDVAGGGDVLHGNGVVIGVAEEFRPVGVGELLHFGEELNVAAAVVSES